MLRGFPLKDRVKWGGKVHGKDATHGSHDNGLLYKVPAWF